MDVYTLLIEGHVSSLLPMTMEEHHDQVIAQSTYNANII